MQALGRLVSHEVVEHFATLLKQGDVPAGYDAADDKSSPANVVRPAAFHKASDLKASAVDLDSDETSDDPRTTRSDASRFNEASGREGRSEIGGSPELRSGVGHPDSGQAGRSDFASVLEKIEAAGASMRLVEERANRQSAWTQDFLAATKTRLRDAELRVQAAESRCELLETRSETAERDLHMAEQRCRATEKRLEAAESRLEAAEHRLEAALELARSAEIRCAEATARALDAERWMQDILQTVQKEFPTAQLL